MARPSNKEDAIIEALKNKIMSGELKAGSKLPTYKKLTEEFSASLKTINKSINCLKMQGFLVGVVRKGVFVSESLPHLERIAILLPSPPQYSRYSTCLEYCANLFSEQFGQKFSIFTNLNGPYYNSTDAERLRKEIEAHMLAGVVWCFNPKDCPDKSLRDLPVTQIFASSKVKEEHAGHHLLWNANSFAKKSLTWMRDNGVKRVALLSYPICNESMIETQKLLHDFGLSSQPQWQISSTDANVSEAIVRLFMSYDQSQCPQGLLVFDDHLMDGVSRGIVAEGIRVPEQLKILSHCNILMPPSCPFPVKLLGWDVRHILNTAVKAIGDCNRGKTSDGLFIEPIFKDEIEPEKLPFFMKNVI